MSRTQSEPIPHVFCACHPSETAVRHPARSATETLDGLIAAHEAAEAARKAPDSAVRQARDAETAARQAVVDHVAKVSPTTPERWCHEGLIVRDGRLHLVRAHAEFSRHDGPGYTIEPIPFVA